jgi:hypothetical protein
VIAGLNRFVEQIIKKLVLDIVANLQAAPSEGGTPVLTGWARANWVPNIGSALDQTAGTRAQAEAGQLSGASAAGVAQVVTEYKLARGPVHITNNVPYILKLDAGSSKQAPAGFIRRGIIKAIRVDLVGR